MGLSYKDLFPDRFLSALQFEGRAVTLTITNVTLESLERSDGPHAVPLVTFAETKKQLVLNRTNAEAFKAMWGNNVDDWLHHKITLFPERDKSPVNDTGWAIRVKGSPDIDETITATIKLPRRKPTTRKLVPTGKGTAPATHPTGAAVHEEAPALDFDADTGEVHEPEHDDLDDISFGDEDGE